jgi:biotin-dependent carboxylase-like uncharacterized protein
MGPLCRPAPGLVSAAYLDVQAPGLLTSVQDTLPRTAYARLGVRPGGAMDFGAAQLANQLVGNPPHAAVLEVTLLGPTVRLGGAARIVALTGADLGATLDEAPVPPATTVLARPGATLAFGEARVGLRAYVAVSGGIDVPLVLGSRSTDLPAGFGGFGGRSLRARDRLPLGKPGTVVAPGRYLVPEWTPPDTAAPIRVLPGPHVDRFTPEALGDLCATTWQITDRADRMGYRLAGGRPLRHQHGADVPSLGLPAGAIQVPADGQPIVLLADHQPTGGYAVLATVIQADLSLLAQRGPDYEVRFMLTTLATAQAALRAQRTGPIIAGDEGERAAAWA